jgi:hypothetical protein
MQSRGRFPIRISGKPIGTRLAGAAPQRSEDSRPDMVLPTGFVADLTINDPSAIYTFGF